MYQSRLVDCLALSRAKIYLQDLGRSKPGTLELNPLRFAGMDLAKELETSGFIDRVFAKNPERRVEHHGKTKAHHRI
jgi:hypothetical protein